MKYKRGHHYFISSTKSGKILAQYGEKNEVIKFSETWIRESPYYDPQDPIIIEQVFVDWGDFKTTKKIIKEYRIMKKKKNSVGFHDMEGNHLSIHWNPTYNRFSVGITDSCGRGTNSIEMGYEDLRSLFKESEEIMIQNTDIIKEKKFPKQNTED